MSKTTAFNGEVTIEGLLNFYRGILKSLFLGVTDDGLIYMDLDGTKLPVGIGSNSNLILPTPRVLKEANWNEYVAFHPLCENVYRGESVVLKKLKYLINLRLTSVISRLLMELAELAVDEDSAEKLTPQQKELFTCLPKADKKTVAKFSKVLNASTTTGHNRLVNIYVKRGGKYKGEEYSQVAVTTFPVREYFDNEENAIFDVKLGNKRDMAGFKALFDYIVPLESEEQYNHGSRSFVAPRFDALMNAYLKVAKQLNSVTWLFRKHLENYNELMINHEWESHLSELAVYRDLIPTLEGNDGEIVQAPAEPDKPTLVPQFNTVQDVQRAATAIPQYQQPVMAPPPLYPPQGYAVPQSLPVEAELPLEENPGQGLSWANLMERKQRAAYTQSGANRGMIYPTEPPPGFAGTPYNPNQVYNQPYVVPPGTYASHPRNQPQPQYYPPQPQYYPPQQYQQPYYPPQQPGYIQPQQYGPPGAIYNQSVL